LVEQESEKSPQVVTRSANWLSWSSFFFALLQSVCTFVVATSSVRILIGLSSLAAAIGSNGEVKFFHQDAIRIPMMLLALAGTVVNLYALWRARNLRNRPAAQWRVQPVTSKRLRSERLQLALSVLTVILLAAEGWAHWATHHPH
jgi:hypothetical protein